MVIHIGTRAMVMNSLQTHKDYCPYCGEPIELLIDASETEQTYIEDCSVCCRPITVQTYGDDDTVSVQLYAEND